MDTVFGCIRAVKEKQFNSCFGIDGAIRKISMLVSIAFLLVLDRIVGLNLIGFIQSCEVLSPSEAHRIRRIFCTVYT